MEEEDALERVGSTGGGFFPDTSERSSHDPASSCCEITNRISVQVEKRLKIGWKRKLLQCLKGIRTLCNLPEIWPSGREGKCDRVGLKIAV